MRLHWIGISLIIQEESSNTDLLKLIIKSTGGCHNTRTYREKSFQFLARVCHQLYVPSATFYTVQFAMLCQQITSLPHKILTQFISSTYIYKKQIFFAYFNTGTKVSGRPICRYISVSANIWVLPITEIRIGIGYRRRPISVALRI